MRHSARFDLDFPDDFPLTEVEAVHAYLSDRHGDETQSEEWKEWATGLNGVLYRFLAAAEDGAAAIESLAESASPPQPRRYQQEKHLFGFYYEGLSALECLFYALYFVGSRAGRTAFPVNVPRRRVTPNHVAKTFTAAYPRDPLSTELGNLVVCDDWTTWNHIRNALSHRGAPGRTFYEGGGPPSGIDWNLPISNVNTGAELEPVTMTARREWLAQVMTTIIQAADPFVRAHIP